MSFVGDIWKYMRKRRKWWLFPVIIILLLLGLLLIFGGSSALGPLCIFNLLRAMNKEYSTILVLVLAFIGLYIFLDKLIFLYLSLGIGGVSLLLHLDSKEHTLSMDEIFCNAGISSAVIILNADFFCDHCAAIVYRKAYR